MSDHRTDDDSCSRRAFLGRTVVAVAGAGLVPLAAASCANDSATPAPAGGHTAQSPHLTNDAAVDRLIPSITNWGRWGPDDQLGTLNFMTDQTRLRAAALIRTGRTVALAREISPVDTPNLRRPQYEMQRYQDAPPEEAGCIDFVGMIFHGYAVTHLDALCHIFTPEGKQGMYNGFPIDDVTPTGAKRLGVEQMGARGIVGRGVLLDVAAVKDSPIPPGYAITPADLEAAEQAGRVTAGEGDVLFVRNGAGAANNYQHGIGLHPDCLPWLHERRIAVLSSDSDSDPHPPPAGFERWTEPVHMIAIPYLGLPLIDNVDLDDLASACREEGRFEFFVSVAPWRLRGTTSSPVNPLAVF